MQTTDIVLESHLPYMTPRDSQTCELYKGRKTSKDSGVGAKVGDSVYKLNLPEIRRSYFYLD